MPRVRLRKTGSMADTLISCTTGAVTVAGQQCTITTSSGVSSPELPRAYVDTTYNLPTGGTTWVVNGGDDLQATLDAAQPGDVIQLAAGATWTGEFNVAARSGSGDIYVVSSALGSLPAEGTRVAPADATNMPKIRCTQPWEYTLAVAPEATNWRFVGIEIATDYDVRTSVQYSIVRVGWPTDYIATTPADRIIFDRCYIHGSPNGNNRDGVVAYQVTNFAVVDSYLADWKGVGIEAHGISLYTPEGPTEIRNNYIEAGGINLFIADSTLPSAAPTPADIRIRDNHLFKPLTWDQSDPSYAGVPILVKNTLELKGGLRVLIERNILENVWVQAQHGQSFVVTPRGRAIDDLTIRNNVCLDFQGGCNFNSANITLRRLSFTNNLLHTTRDMIGRWCYTISGPPGNLEDITIEHCTFLATGTTSGGLWLIFNGSQQNEVQGIRVYDNLSTHGLYGVLGNGKGVGFASVDFYCFDYDFNLNGLIATPAGYEASFYQDAPGYNGWFHPVDNVDVQFVNLAFTNLSHFALQGGSPYANMASDGTDPGVDISLLPTF